MQFVWVNNKIRLWIVSPCLSFFLFYSAVLFLMFAVIHKGSYNDNIHHLLSLFPRKFQECPLLWRSLNRLLPHRLPVANRLPLERWKATRTKSPKLHKLSSSVRRLYRSELQMMRPTCLIYRNVNLLGTLFIAVCWSAALASFVTACLLHVWILFYSGGQ